MSIRATSLKGFSHKKLFFDMLFSIKGYVEKSFTVCKKKKSIKCYGLLKIQFVMHKLYSLHYNLQKKTFL